MTDSDDPLLSFLYGELAQIEEAVGFRRRLIVPIAPLEDVDGETQTFNWMFRYTWQEVERGRRYVIPLERERAFNAQQAAIAEIIQLAMSQIMADARVASDMSGSLVDSAQRVTWASPEGVAVEFVNDPSVIALPVSAIRRRVSFRAGLNAYSVSESVLVGPLQLHRPELVAVV